MCAVCLRLEGQWCSHPDPGLIAHLLDELGGDGRQGSSRGPARSPGLRRRSDRSSPTASVSTWQRAGTPPMHRPTRITSENAFRNPPVLAIPVPALVILDRPSPLLIPQLTWSSTAGTADSRIRTSYCSCSRINSGSRRGLMTLIHTKDADSTLISSSSTDERETIWAAGRELNA